MAETDRRAPRRVAYPSFGPRDMGDCSAGVFLSSAPPACARPNNAGSRRHPLRRSADRERPDLAHPSTGRGGLKRCWTAPRRWPDRLRAGLDQQLGPGAGPPHQGDDVVDAEFVERARACPCAPCAASTYNWPARPSTRAARSPGPEERTAAGAGGSGRGRGWRTARPRSRGPCHTPRRRLINRGGDEH